MFQFFTFSILLFRLNLPSLSPKSPPDPSRPLPTPPLIYSSHDFLLLIWSCAIFWRERDVLSRTAMNIHFYDNNFKGYSPIFLLNSSAILYTFYFPQSQYPTYFLSNSLGNCTVLDTMYLCLDAHHNSFSISRQRPFSLCLQPSIFSIHSGPLPGPQAHHF